MRAESTGGSRDGTRDPDPPSLPACIRFGRETCGDLAAGLRREWLVTNGLGGYASGTVVGANTRRYHGLLVAAVTPPVERTVLVGGLMEWAGYDGRRYPLSAHEYGDGTVDPRGYRYLESFMLEGILPVWRFALGDALLERRLLMPHGENTTYVLYRLVRGGAALSLEVAPLVTYRDFHALTSGRGWAPRVEPVPAGAAVTAFHGARPLRLLSAEAQFEPGGDWYWNFRHREEAARGLDDRSDLYAAGRFTAVLRPGTCVTLAFTVEPDAAPDGAGVLATERRRQIELVRRVGVEDADAVMRQLVLAADQFIVARQASAPSPGGAASPGEGAPRPSDSSAGLTVVAGYHWFNDWGRDTMVALPGLTLATGRPDDAAGILRAFARYVVDGLLPNNFPDVAGTDPGYNTADATLWYVLAVRAYEEATGDHALADELLPMLTEILDRHIAGTRYGIGVDPADGLLRAGEPGLQLTWMDAKVGDWVVTPRIGKPVEINALWYNALRTVAALLDRRGDRAAEGYAALADRHARAFRARFRRPDVSHLADVVDGPDGDDWSLRPNQIFAVSLPFPLVEGDAARDVVDAVGRALLTSHGLRSLSPEDPAYRGDYGGDPARRDGAYHQGPVWSWLIGAYVEAHLRVHGDREAARALLEPFADHLRDAGLGSISEIFEGDAPHAPRGCIAQAWSVAEVLRLWRLLAEGGRSAAGSTGTAGLAATSVPRPPESSPR